MPIIAAQMKNVAMENIVTVQKTTTPLENCNQIDMLVSVGLRSSNLREDNNWYRAESNPYRRKSLPITIRETLERELGLTNNMGFCSATATTWSLYGLVAPYRLNQTRRLGNTVGT